MNLPNKLSLARVILVPVCIFFILFDKIPFNYLIALVVFGIASITDFLDGHIARSRHLVTNFGKFVDPLADKLLVCSVLICLIPVGVAPAVAVIIIIAREFAVSGLRIIAAEQKIVLAANIWGKIKTVSQIVVICVSLFCLQFLNTPLFIGICTWLMWTIAAITIASGVTYFAANIACLKTQD